MDSREIESYYEYSFVIFFSPLFVKFIQVVNMALVHLHYYVLADMVIPQSAYPPVGHVG